MTPIWSKNTNNISKTSVQNYKVDDYLAGNVYIDGKPVNAVYAWEFTGLDPKTGFATFKGCSSNEDEVEKSDDPATYLKYVGPADPRFNGGLSSSLRWKNLTLSAQFAFGFGNYKRLNFIFEGDNKITDLLYLVKTTMDNMLPYEQLLQVVYDRYTAVHANLGLEVDMQQAYDEIKDKLRDNPSADYIASR